LMNVVYKLPGALECSWLLPATFNNSWSKTQNIGAFWNEIDTFGRLCRGPRVTTLALRWRPGGQTHAAYIQKSASFPKCASRLQSKHHTLVCLSHLSTGFIINEQKQVLNLLLLSKSINFQRKKKSLIRTHKAQEQIDRCDEACVYIILWHLPPPCYFLRPPHPPSIFFFSWRGEKLSTETSSCSDESLSRAFVTCLSQSKLG
jgi:hypothetical protein